MGRGRVVPAEEDVMTPYQRGQRDGLLSVASCTDLADGMAQADAELRRRGWRLL